MMESSLTQNLSIHKAISMDNTNPHVAWQQTIIHNDKRKISVLKNKVITILIIQILIQHNQFLHKCEIFNQFINKNNILINLVTYLIRNKIV